MISFIVETVSNSNGCSGNNVANVNATKPLAPSSFVLAPQEKSMFKWFLYFILIVRYKMFNDELCIKVIWYDLMYY